MTDTSYKEIDWIPNLTIFRPQELSLMTDFMLNFGCDQKFRSNRSDHITTEVIACICTDTDYRETDWMHNLGMARLTDWSSRLQHRLTQTRVGIVVWSTGRRGQERAFLVMAAVVVVKLLLWNSGVYSLLLVYQFQVRTGQQKWHGLIPESSIAVRQHQLWQQKTEDK